MTKRADADKLPAEHKLRQLASDFNKAAEGFYSEPQTVTVGRFMAAWTKTRKAWAKYSGESLI